MFRISLLFYTLFSFQHLYLELVKLHCYCMMGKYCSLGISYYSETVL